MLRLHCLVEGQDAVFSVQVPLDARVQDLCQRVRKERKLSMFVDSELLPWKVSVCVAEAHYLTPYPPLLQVDIDLTPYNYDFQGLKLLKVEEKRDTRLALWRNLSDFWSDDHLPPDRRLHILVKLSPIGEYAQNSIGWAPLMSLSLSTFHAFRLRLRANT